MYFIDFFKSLDDISFHILDLEKLGQEESSWYENQISQVNYLKHHSFVTFKFKDKNLYDMYIVKNIFELDEK